MNFSIKFEPRDAWVGLFWDVKNEDKKIKDPNYGFTVGTMKCRNLYIYLCVIPFLPIIFKKEIK